MIHKKTISWWFILLVVSVVVIGCDCHPVSPSWDCDYDGDYVVQETFSYSLPEAGHTGLRLEGINGSVTITGTGSAQSITVAGERFVGSYSRADAEAHLQDLEVQIDDRGSEILVKTIQPPESHGRSYVVEYEITVPNDLEIFVQNLNGGVRLEGIHGSTYVDLVNGEIDGRISLPVEGVAELSIVNGTVRLDIPASTSARFSASVVNGNIDVSGLTLHDSTSTRQSLQGTLGNGRGRIALGVVNGNIRVTGYSPTLRSKR
jgi:DUF4097 and DUF4098 domain-containing protein YvlB